VSTKLNIMNIEKCCLTSSRPGRSFLIVTVCFWFSLPAVAQINNNTYLLRAEKIKFGENISCLKNTAIATNTLVMEKGATVNIASVCRIELYPGVNISNGSNLVVAIEVPDGQSRIETDVAAIKIYPNPSHGILYIQSPGIVESIQVKDMNGNRVMELPGVQKPELRIDISALDAGFYMFEIVGSNGTLKTLRIQKK
jgi:hypothetical protein